jgi:hypothetical protein
VEVERSKAVEMEGAGGWVGVGVKNRPERGGGGQCHSSEEHGKAVPKAALGAVNYPDSEISKVPTISAILNYSQLSSRDSKKHSPTSRLEQISPYR